MICYQIPDSDFKFGSDFIQIRLIVDYEDLTNSSGAPFTINSMVRRDILPRAARDRCHQTPDYQRIAIFFVDARLPAGTLQQQPILQLQSILWLRLTLWLPFDAALSCCLQPRSYFSLFFCAGSHQISSYDPIYGCLLPSLVSLHTCSWPCNGNGARYRLYQLSRHVYFSSIAIILPFRQVTYLPIILFSHVNSIYGSTILTTRMADYVGRVILSFICLFYYLQLICLFFERSGFQLFQRRRGGVSRSGHSPYASPTYSHGTHD